MALFGLATVVGTSTAFHQTAMVQGQTARRPERTSQHDSGSTSSASALHYTSSNDASTSSPRWWKILLSSPESAAAASSSSTTTAAPTAPSGEASQQETVDAYLEFLDRRYRRLHSDEEEARKRKQQADESAASSTNSPKSAPFSAMDWLMNGSSNNSPTAEQHEDALYVLGVAGLASQKLLQKHHLLQQTDSIATPTLEGVATKQSASLKDDAIEVQAEASLEEDNDATSINLPSQLFIKKVLVPLIRAAYIVQRRKDQVVQRIQSKVGAVAARAAQKVVNPVARRIRQGPKAVVESLLEIGGGRRNLAFTLACAYATVVLLRPILQAACAEASVGP